MYDHLNSGILNGGLEGPGLNIGLVEGLGCFVLLDSVEHKIEIKFRKFLVKLVYR